MGIGLMPSTCKVGINVCIEGMIGLGSKDDATIMGEVQVMT